MPRNSIRRAHLFYKINARGDGINMNIDINVSQRFMSFLNDWDYEKYLLIGGYGSGKSDVIATKLVLKLLQEKRTVLVTRAVKDTIKDSCFALFKKVLTRMNLLAEGTTYHNKSGTKVVAISSPLELRFPNGSKVIFRGTDDTEKLKSIDGVSIAWMEECSEMTYDAYKEILGRVREPGVTCHFILSCNPVGKENWVYTNFFVHMDNKGKEHTIQDPEQLYKRRTIVNPSNGVYYHHSVPDDNPFLPESYIKRLDELRFTDPRLWTVARWGRFGANGIRVLPRFCVAKDAASFKKAVINIPAAYHFFGLDFGFETSYNALLACAVDDANKILYIYDEVYMNHITDDKFCKLPEVLRIKQRAERCDKAIAADAAEPKTIQFYRQQGYSMYGAKKYAGSRLQNTKKLKRFNKIICSPLCINTIRELRDLTYKKDSRGNAIYDVFNIDPHTMSALWYALDTYTVSDLKDIETNSHSA